MGAIITDKGRALIAQLQAEHKILTIDKFVYADVAAIDPKVDPPPTVVMPAPADIKYEGNISKQGYVGPDTVVYSSMLGTDIGNWPYNWIGLYCTNHSTLVAVIYTQLTEKKKTDAFNVGNIISKNFAIQYVNIKDISGIVIKAESWQIDFTTRFGGIDERERLSNLDLYGKKFFTGDAFKIVNNTENPPLNPLLGGELAADGYHAMTGTAYIDGIQIKNTAVYVLGDPGALPKNIYIDAWLDGDFHGVIAKWKITVSAFTIANYVDTAGQQHYVEFLAVINANSSITDFRNDDYTGRIRTKTCISEIGGFWRNWVEYCKFARAIGADGITYVAQQKNHGLNPVGDAGLIWEKENQYDSKQYKTTFSNTDLTAGKFIFLHKLNSTNAVYNILDGEGNNACPDVNIKINSGEIDVSNILPIEGTWQLTMFASIAVGTNENADSDLFVQDFTDGDLLSGGYLNVVHPLKSKNIFVNVVDGHGNEAYPEVGIIDENNICLGLDMLRPLEGIWRIIAGKIK